MTYITMDCDLLHFLIFWLRFKFSDKYQYNFSGGKVAHFLCVSTNYTQINNF